MANMMVSRKGLCKITAWRNSTRNFQDMTNKMKAIVGQENVSKAPSTLEQHSHDESYHSYLKDFGLWFPVDPGADASLCGMAATGASGTNTVRYGAMKENVLNLEVVLANGEIIHTAGKGYNLTNLFVGSEGTLGIITAATLKLHAVPESILSAVCFFPSIEDAVASAVNIIQAGIPIARIEYLDERSIEAANKFSNMSNPIKSSLFLEFHGSVNGTKEQVGQVGEIVLCNNGSNFEWAENQEDRNRLWKARHDMYYAIMAVRPGAKGYTTDICVPISQLPEAMIYAQHVAEASGLPYGIIGHVGDGNFHCVFCIDPSNPKEMDKCKDAAEKIGQKSLDLQGTCTGEHGIGLGKRKLLMQEMGEAINVMKSLKSAVDPFNMMNPGKVL